MLTPEDYRKLYQLTEKVTPLASDCGQLCSSVCCRPNPKDSLGMYLFPGEEVMFTRKEDWLEWEEHDPQEYLFPISWKDTVYFIKCKRPCPRDMRPLACRFFPLTPHLLRDGTLLMIYETMSLPYNCPLIAHKLPLEPNFIQTVGHCWQVLLQDPRIRDLIAEDSLEREEDGEELPEVLFCESPAILSNTRKNG